MIATTGNIKTKIGLSARNVSGRNAKTNGADITTMATTTIAAPTTATTALTGTMAATTATTAAITATGATALVVIMDAETPATTVAAAGIKRRRSAIRMDPVTAR